MALRTYDCGSACPVEATLEVLGGRWKGILVYHLLEEPRQFNALHRLVPAITHRMLTLQLRQLERDGVVTRTERAGPVRTVEYACTPLGLSLAPIIDAMVVWGLQRLAARPSAA